jgi:hypothetical protein
MALIDCPECGNQISEFANDCPNCGFPIAEQEEKSWELRSLEKENRLKRILFQEDGVIVYASGLAFTRGGLMPGVSKSEMIFYAGWKTGLVDHAFVQETAPVSFFGWFDLSPRYFSVVLKGLDGEPNTEFIRHPERSFADRVAAAINDAIAEYTD